MVRGPIAPHAATFADGVKGDLPGGINGDLAEWSDSDENEDIAEAAGQLASWSFMMAAA